MYFSLNAGTFLCNGALLDCCTDAFIVNAGFFVLNEMTVYHHIFL